MGLVQRGMGFSFIPICSLITFNFFVWYVLRSLGFDDLEPLLFVFYEFVDFSLYGFLRLSFICLLWVAFVWFLRLSFFCGQKNKENVCSLSNAEKKNLIELVFLILTKPIAVLCHIWKACVRNAIRHGHPISEVQILKKIVWEVRWRISGAGKFNKTKENICICQAWNLDLSVLV